MNDLSSKITADPGRFPGRFTTSEFRHMCEVGAFQDIKVELVDGEIERLNPPQDAHSRRQTQLLILLAQVCPVSVLRVEVGVELEDGTVLGCDLAMLRTPVPTRYWRAPSDLSLVIEVSVSTLARDVGVKLSRYAAVGIENYWVVDDEGAVVHVYGRPVDGEYRDEAVVGFGEPLSVPGTGALITLT